MSPPSTYPTSSSKKRLVYGKDDALFGCIEEQQGEKPFGSVLDAGTGLHSLRWIATLESKGMTNFTAITADKTMHRNVEDEATALDISHLGRILIGNWFDASTSTTNDDNVYDYATLSSLEKQFLKGDGDRHEDQSLELFDTILADYLIGAMDGFSPYTQDLMLPKLCRLLKPGGRLYIVGLQPIPDSAPGPANIMCKVRKIRDACILLAGHRCYREYPVDWIQRQLQGISIPQRLQQNDKSELEECSSSEEEEDHYGFQLIQTSRFPILYRHQTIVTQINVARSKLSLFPSPELASEMKTILDDLEGQSLEATSASPNGRIKLGFDYVVSAEKISINQTKGVSMD